VMLAVRRARRVVFSGARQRGGRPAVTWL
jgi:hypothetical protein